LRETIPPPQNATVPAATKPISSLAAQLAERLDDRARRVLEAIVADYIDTAEPVGSQSVARRPGLGGISSATVRSVMSDLEALGLLEKPHTSAGRIPTSLGYRFYVDALVRIKPPGMAEKQMIERRTQDAAAQGDVLKETTRLLHSLSRHAGVVGTPRGQAERLARIDLVALREDRVLAVLVSKSGAVQNRLLLQPPGARPTQAELDRMSGYLNATLSDLTLAQARERLTTELAAALTELNELKSRAATLGAAAIAIDESAGTVLIEGQASFLEEPALLQSLDKMRALLRALEEKKGLVQVLDRVIEAQELTIFIGQDSGLAEPAEVSIVAAPYRVAGEIVGTLGVIGPTRMDYSRVIPLVEFTARTIGSALEIVRE
jgi:heat-inducible transcriptional repressor